jgi:hypothetical protein
MLPDFIVIGPAKTGSRWIYECLKEHPSICLAKNLKGSRFFERYFHRGIEWYENFFISCPPDSVKGEVDETYISCAEAPERIHRHIPNAKLITCLRNPLDRTFSSYLQFRKMGLIKEPFETALNNYRKILISDTLYYDHLTNYLKFFTAEKILILLFDDLQKDPARFIEKIFRFLDVDYSFKPALLDSKVNVASEPRSVLINKFAIKTSLLLRKWDMFGIHNWASNSKILRKILFSRAYGKDYSSMSDCTRKKLQDEYRDQINGLSDLIGKDLSHWK